MNLEANLMNAPITTTPAGDILANIHELEWLDVGGGTQFKVLRICEKTGQWALYVHMEPPRNKRPIAGSRSSRGFKKYEKTTSEQATGSP